PNGTLQTTQNFTSSSTVRGSWNWWTLTSSTIGSSPGTWRVAMEMGGTELVSRTFVVTTGAGTPAVKVAKGTSAIITNRTTPWDFGSVAVGGAPPSQTFAITNFGTAPLNLSNLALPPGFALSGAFPTTLAAGATANLTINLTTNTPGYKFGAIQFKTNDPDRPTFNFNIAGTVTGAAPAGAPILSLSAPALAYTVLGQVNVIDPSATVADPHSPNFARGSLTAEFTYVSSPEDVLGVRSVGSGQGQIGMSGASVTYEGVPIGNSVGGDNASPLVISLNANA